MNLGKKGQMELIGLVIIVILLTVGMLFLAQFALKEEPQKKIFTRKGLAYSTMSALMKTTVEETGCLTQMEGKIQLGADVIEDCATHYPPDPFTASVYQCRQQHSCEFLREFIPELLEQSLGQWNKRYQFQLTLLRPANSERLALLPPITAQSGGCPPGRERDSSGLFPLTTEAGIVEAMLYVCDPD